MMSEWLFSIQQFYTPKKTFIPLKQISGYAPEPSAQIAGGFVEGGSTPLAHWSDPPP